MNYAVGDTESADEARYRKILDSVEIWLEMQRDRLPLLIPIGLAVGNLIWLKNGNPAFWPFAVGCLAVGLFGLAAGFYTRLGRALVMSAMLAIIGFAVIAAKATMFATPALPALWMGTVYGRVDSVEPVAARGIVRLVLQTDSQSGLPAKIRANLPQEKMRPEFAPGAIIEAKVRLMPPPGPALPDGYDFARQAWFLGLGATGTIFDAPKLLQPAAGQGAFWQQSRNRIAAHIEQSMPKGSGAIGSALLVGTRGGISDEDAEALRNSGMAHLLSVSGLHVTAIVGAAFLLFSRLLALYPFFALRWRVPVVAASLSALVAVGYTLLTGSEVPTVRSCIAALLVMMAMVIGREAISLRLLAAGASIVLLFWPEALAGPSFQLSFAAVATIIVLHESEYIRRWTESREEHPLRKMSRFVFSLLLTGFAIELALAPIALFHFHQSGIYGALANIIAIPLTTFIIMPAQLCALMADSIGMGRPFWWIAGHATLVIRDLAHAVSSAPGAVFVRPAAPHWAFGLITCGGIWLAVFRGRLWGGALVVILVGILATVMAPRPDILITGDGRHLAVVSTDGSMALLRPAARDYARDLLSENAAVTDEAIALDDWPGAQCSADICTFAISRGGRNWTFMATRSRYLVSVMEMAAACHRVDVVISERRLPYSCKPRWLKMDRSFLEPHGGVALYLAAQRVETVAATTAHQPWSTLGKFHIAQRRPFPNQ